MKIYFVVPTDKNLPTHHMKTLKEKVEAVVVIHHVGKMADLKELAQLRNDPGEKIIAIDPASFEWDFDAQTLKDIPNVVAVCPSTTSFDWIKPIELKKLNIKGCNCPGFSSESVAEYAVCMAIDCARKLPIAIKNGWKLDFAERGMLLKGKKAGVIGLGRIGTKMAEKLQGLGMKVVYWSRQSTDERFTKIELDELFAGCDVIMPALVENEDTKQLITKERIDTMKSTAILVGINRVKEIYDETYVLQKVAQGELGGYAFEGENRQELDQYEGNVWALPPIAWQTQDSLDTLMEVWVKNMIATAEGKPQHVVN
jgi:lactate dehydrogenase-like 2-hydroxyacid dehydrogenase